MWHVTWNRIRHSTGRLALTVIAVAVGIAFLTAALVLTDSTRAALRDSYTQIYAGTDVVVRGPETFGDGPFSDGTVPLTDAALTDIRGVPGVAQTEGRPRSVAQLSPTGDSGTGEAALAVAVPDDPDGAAIDVRTGRLPQRAGEVAVDAAAAAAVGVATGDRVHMLLPDRQHTATVVGTVGFGRLDGLAGGARVLFYADTATDLFGGAGYAEIAVRARDGVTADALRRQLMAAVGDKATVLTATQAAHRDATAAARQTAAVGWILAGVAAVALLVGALLVANTLRMLVGQRLRELALLRAVGADRRQVAASILIEAGLAGGLGGAAGVAVGVAAGALLVGTAGGLLPGVPPATATLTPRALLVGPVVGITVAVLASSGATRNALRVPPVAALRSSAGSAGHPSRLRWAAGGVLFTAGVAGAVSGAANNVSVLLAVGAAGLIVGVGLLFPLATGPLLHVISWPLTRAGAVRALARQQTLATPGRAGATAAALAVALALVTFLLVLSASLGSAVGGLIAARQHAEFTIRSTAREGLHDFLFDAADRADQLPGVRAARVVTYGQMRIHDPAGDDARPRAVTAFVTDPTVVAELFDLHVADGDIATLGRNDVAVRDTIAAANNWRIGDQLRVDFPDDATIAVTVAGTFTGAVTTDYVVAPPTADAHLPGAYREAFVKLDAGTDPDTVRRRLESTVGAFPAADVLSRGQQAAQAGEANENTLGIITALFALSLIVGVLGVVNTLTLAIIERLRELGLLRAVGATRSQVRALIRWEAALVSLLGVAVGAALGLGLAWIAVHALPEQGQTFVVPGWHVTIAVLATGLLGVLASVIPSIRAARVDVLRAIHAQ